VDVTTPVVVKFDLRELEILEHLTYIIEAIAEGVTGEAKREVYRLHRVVEEDTELAADVRREALAGLSRAQEAIQRHPLDIQYAATSLSRLSRFLWQRVLGDFFNPGTRGQKPAGLIETVVEGSSRRG